MLEVQGKPILVGGGTDGAAVNVSDQNGMKGTLNNNYYFKLYMYFLKIIFVHNKWVLCKLH